MKTAFILGIDPGSRKTGFAVLGRDGRRLYVVESGTITLPVQDELSSRLGRLHQRLETIVARINPETMAVEDIFTAVNAKSALALGHARGVVLSVAGRLGIPVCAYPPATIKRAVAGNGRANKVQIQRMVQVLLSLGNIPATDEADAMAIAICHALCRKAQRSLAANSKTYTKIGA